MKSFNPPENIVGYFEEIEGAIINLSQYSVLEDNPKNRGKFLNLLLEDFGNANTRNSLKGDASVLFRLIKETRADYYMCSLLGLDHCNYEDLAGDNLNDKN